MKNVYQPGVDSVNGKNQLFLQATFVCQFSKETENERPVWMRSPLEQDGWGLLRLNLGGSLWMCADVNQGRRELLFKTTLACVT